MNERHNITEVYILWQKADNLYSINFLSQKGTQMTKERK